MSKAKSKKNFSPRKISPPPLDDFDGFKEHPWTQQAVGLYKQKAVLSEYARETIVKDLFDLDNKYRNENNGLALFSAVDARVKNTNSYLKKLLSIYKEVIPKSGMTKDIFDECQQRIHDLLGVRFAVPYYDKVLPTIKEIVRPFLISLNYATDLSSEGYADHDYLDKGDENGYRSYHFFVMIPTAIDIYGKTELCLCEVQARSELEHVWAVKSRDLFYKPSGNWIPTDKYVKNDMIQISHQLRAIDEHLVNIRRRMKGGEEK